MHFVWQFLQANSTSEALQLKRWNYHMLPVMHNNVLPFPMILCSLVAKTTLGTFMASSLTPDRVLASTEYTKWTLNSTVTTGWQEVARQVTRRVVTATYSSLSAALIRTQSPSPPLLSSQLTTLFSKDRNWMGEQAWNEMDLLEMFIMKRIQGVEKIVHLREWKQSKGNMNFSLKSPETLWPCYWYTRVVTNTFHICLLLWDNQKEV